LRYSNITADIEKMIYNLMHGIGVD